MNALNAYEKFALNHFLSSYPEGYDIQSIFNMMLEYSEDVLVWDMFFNEEPADVIREIETMIITLEQSFVPREGA
jgi:hypothetical protein